MNGNLRAWASGMPDLPTCCSSIAVASQAAWIWFFSMPASLIASPEASTIRSSASWSQRSPNFEQPMPRIATLSRMPLAMSCLLRGTGRCRLPEITRESALRVVVLDAEHHAHRQADTDVCHVHVGEVHQEPPAGIELHHAEDGRRIGRIGELVGGVGVDLAAHIGERMVGLGVESVAVGIDADIRLRKLQRAAFAAAPADQTQYHVAFAIQRRQRRLFVELGAHAALERYQFVEGEESVVVGLFAAPREIAAYAHAWRQLALFRGRLEQKRIAALAETDHQNPLARLGCRERIGQPPQRGRGSGLAADGGQGVAPRAPGDAGPPRPPRPPPPP